MNILERKLPDKCAFLNMHDEYLLSKMLFFLTIKEELDRENDNFVLNSVLFTRNNS